MKERNEQQELLMRQLLEDANIPALSIGWYQKEHGVTREVAYGQTDTLAPRPVDTHTLFQAASLSKPVSAAIVLDLIDQDKDKSDLDLNKWTLDTPLYKYDPEFGSEELRKDPNYQKVTIRMIIGQCSGLANFGQDGDDGKKFIAVPGSRFTYSGVALDLLKKVIEKKVGKEWEVIAQDFFKKTGMENSTFQRQLPNGILHDTPREVAKAHIANSPNSPLFSLPPLPDNAEGIPAGSLLTTAEDYVTFLQYCFKDKYFSSAMLEGVLSELPSTLSSLYVMSELPKNSIRYKNSYLFIKKNDTKDLYYINSNGEFEKVKIVDLNLFEKKINAIKNKDETQLHLCKEQINDIITSNGGHHPPVTSRVKWSLGMGIYSEGAPQKPEKTVAFHWGNNEGSISFFAMDLVTGDCVVSFANSLNGPSVFQRLVEPIVGDIKPLFQWLSRYCFFKDVNQPEKPHAIAANVLSIYSLAGVEIPKPTDSTQKMVLLMPTISKPELNPDESQKTVLSKPPAAQENREKEAEKEKTEEFNSTPLSTPQDFHT